MTPYLQQIAQFFVNHHSDDLWKYRFLFPNRRAGLFFKHYLMEAVGDTPIISPSISTFNEYIHSKTGYVATDPAILIAYLYRAYIGIHQHKEGGELYSFERFFHIGEMLLVDFNDIDKHLVDPEKVLSNLYDIKEIDNDLNYLSDKQRQIIAEFFSPNIIEEDRKEMRKRFLLFWKSLLPLYNSYKTILKESGCAYEGMALRELYETKEEWIGENSDDHCIPVFIGFNALTPCERKLMLHIRTKQPLTQFFWDYDTPPLRESSYAGKFSKENLRDFPQTEIDGLNVGTTTDDYQYPDIEVVSIPSAVGQTRYVGNIIEEINQSSSESIRNLAVAVVLPNQRLLSPLLHNISANISDLNITMGYPVKDTPIVALIELLLSSRIRREQRPSWRGEEVIEIIRLSCLEKYISQSRDIIVQRIRSQKMIFITPKELVELIEELDIKTGEKELLKLLFIDQHSTSDTPLSPINYIRSIILYLDQIDKVLMEISKDDMLEEDPNDESDTYLNDSLYPLIITYLDQVETLVSKMIDIDEHLSISDHLVTDLIITTLRSGRIPYTGEPLKGLQIMGLLETRCLDFETVIIPDAVENLLPPKRSSTGIIPFFLRQAFEMPTYQWQDYTIAYNFYRLITRAKRVIMTYDARKNETSDGEPSRFVSGLNYIYNAGIKFKEMSYILKPIQEINPQEDVSVELIDRYIAAITSSNGEKGLSPSHIRTYMECPRRFYYQVICGLREDDELQELMDNRHIGNIVHSSLKCLYDRYFSSDKLLNKEILNSFLKHKWSEVLGTINAEFKKELYGSDDKDYEAEGYNSIQLEVAAEMVKNIIQKDIKDLETLRYIGGEIKLTSRLQCDGHRVNLKGFIDRVDYVTAAQQLRIIDFKTGKDSYDFVIPDIDSDLSKVNGAAFQLLMYCMILDQKDQDLKIYDTHLPDYESLRPIINKPLHKSNDGSIIWDKQPLTNYDTVKSQFEEFVYQVVSYLLNDRCFSPDPSLRCAYCDARGICRAEYYSNDIDSKE